jgi:hypothetical protein
MSADCPAQVVLGSKTMTDRTGIILGISNRANALAILGSNVLADLSIDFFPMTTVAAADKQAPASRSCTFYATYA